MSEVLDDDKEVTEQMAEEVQMYVDYIRDLRDSIPGAYLMIEQRVPIDHLTGEDGAEGTADAVIVCPDELIIVDLKFGYDPVSAEDNPQLQMYALGVIKALEAI